MNLGPILGAALEAQLVCAQLRLPVCVIGGLALQRWGEPRFTSDADLCVMVEAGDEPRVIQALFSRFAARLAGGEEFALRARVLLARATNGVNLDIVLAGLPYEARMLDRSSLWELTEADCLRTCSAEDLIVMKTFAGRDKDWADITSVLERQGPKLNLPLVRSELSPLLEAKEAPELAVELERRIQKIRWS